MIDALRAELLMSFLRIDVFTFPVQWRERGHAAKEVLEIINQLAVIFKNSTKLNIDN